MALSSQKTIMADQMDWPFNGDPLADLSGNLGGTNDLGTDIFGDIDGK